MVEDSFERIEDVVKDYALRRIRQMEQQLDSLDRDLTEFIESARETEDQTRSNQ